MKKKLFPIALCIIAGLFLGTYMFSKSNDNDTKKVSAGVKENKSIYVFQYGVYSDKKNIPTNIKNSYELLENKYYIYVAMTADTKNRDKLKQYFSKQSIEVYVKEIQVISDYYDILKQYDLLLNEAISNESIKTILETALAKFEELALDDENKRITS